MSDAVIYQTPIRAWLDIDLAALRRNGAALMQQAGVPLIPMVKADAYGVGAEAVLRALEPLAPWGYGVATVKEGETLRRYGVTRSVVVFTPLLLDEFPAAAAARLTPTLGGDDVIRAWATFGGPWHLAVDTGMSRAGVPWREIASVVSAASAFPPEGAFTHFHSAELDDGSMEEEQRRFREAVAQLPARPRVLHTDNSAAIVRHRRCEWDAVRPGVFLYGVGSGDHAALQPEPVVHMRARVVELRSVEPGDSVSYDATYRASERRWVATVAAGYGDGYPRALSNRGVGILRGRRVPVLGRVTMDMTMFDVTGVPCEVGDVVTLMGRDGDQLTTAEEVGAWAEMSPYELLTGLSVRLDRVYHQG